NLRLDQITLNANGSTARALWNGAKIGDLSLSVPGEHNLLNAAAVLAVGMELGLNISSLLDGLAKFHGAGRRFELKGSVNGIRVIDDYGHHPNEIVQTLTVARKSAHNRLHVVFQPHRFTRTKFLWHEFIQTFAHSTIDSLIITDIYPASEAPITDITSQRLVTELAQHNP
ncbi:MAG: UDP-N-acetylmuramate--L-alanine ligase, partial [Burkholderiaceae bacterium]|nr:UDP-N-acetylmuramate--L-alanine ligase [Burkholderiaceae bacterium]